MVPTTFFFYLKNFLEVILLIGIFLGVSTNLNLQKEKDILIAAGFGIGLSLFIPTIIFIFGAEGSGMLSIETIKILEGFVLILSAFFMFLVMFLLHKFHLNTKRVDSITKLHKFTHIEFDFMLFTTLFIFLIFRELEMGYLMLVSTSSSLVTEIISLAMALFISLLVGLLITGSYRKLDVVRVLNVNKYALILFVALVSLSGVGMLVLI